MAVIKFRDSTKVSVLGQIKTAIDAGGAAGKLRIYSGSIPAAPSDAASGTLLAELTLSFPCAPTASGSPIKLTFSAITQDSTADATGTAGYARILASDGTAIFDCDVTVTGAGGVLQLNTTSIVIGGPVLVTAFELSVP